MSTSKRNAPDSGVFGDKRTFFVTSSSDEKRALFQSERMAELFCKTLIGYRDAGRFLLHAFGLMPNHFHALITVDSSLSIERAVQFIKGGFSHSASMELSLRSSIWQRGFSEARILEAERFLRATEYIHHNPVRRGLCVSPAEFKYSSASGAFAMDPMPQGLKPR